MGALLRPDQVEERHPALTVRLQKDMRNDARATGERWWQRYGSRVLVDEDEMLAWLTRQDRE